MCTNYKLRDCIDAHDKDVKSIVILPQNNDFLSASRDLSVRLWQEENKHYKQNQQYLFHKSYISVVHFMKPCLEYPNGVIFSAGYDKVINGYFINSVQVQFSLNGHTNAVTSIASTDKCDIISGSMDGTAALWDLTTSTIKKTYKGHKHGIWSLILLESMPEHFLTASADKEIFLWNEQSNDIQRKFIGHTDCVRGLMEIAKSEQFLSCSNDNTIRSWCLKTGSCLNQFRGHTSFIYSIVRISDDRFVTCGEDSSIFIWNQNINSAPLQKISVNAQSVWCVSVFDNGDIITGSSDGLIRLFSEDPLLQHGVELKPKISKDVMDDSMVKSLPSVGIEILSLPGDYDHQLLKVRDEGCDILYEWSSTQELWVKKKVIGQSATVAAKTHDYVFSIDIKDGEPPLKLNYNLGQDPWVVAKTFLDDNDLSPMFLDQVANFIIANSNQQVPAVSPPVEFNDPFTGNSRYVPTNTAQSSNGQHQFPYKSYLRFDQLNATGLSKKLQEMCITNRLPDIIRNNIEHIHNLSTDESNVLCTWVLDKFPTWPEDQMFPLIDLLRMLVREPTCNSLCFTDNEFLVKLLSRTIGSKSEVCSKGNTLTMIKLMVNAFHQMPGEYLMNTMNKQIADALHEVIQSNTDKNILVAAASWLLNMSVSINLRQEEYRRTEIIELGFSFLEAFQLKNCSEAVYRTLVTIGTLVCNSDSFTFRETLTMNVCEKLHNFCKIFSDEIKWGVDVRNCSQQLGILIASLDFNLNF